MNALRWRRQPGHYEVYYLTFTDPASGAGVWIRYTLLAPLEGQATCSLWFASMEPESGRTSARRDTQPIDALKSTNDPFKLSIGESVLDNGGARGSCEGATWDLCWQSRLPGVSHVDPLLARARIASTVLTLPHPELLISGTITIDGKPMVIDGARGGQAHLWGTRHASRWAWMHCNDLRSEAGEPATGSYIDGVAVYLPRFGREIGPSTPVVGRLLGEDFRSTAPWRVLRNEAEIGVRGLSVEARARSRRVEISVTARAELMVGVTYHDPDGTPAYCYNSEVASMRALVWDRTRRGGGAGWELRETLVSDGRAHFEYAQRQPLADIALAVE